ncbi:MAG: GDP-mannose 4,6-dehydratase [Candidatus Eiseniibacteriota bacterium]|nr:MAG: GDP-mannose 4,6-dehydratase [Candidatus Eisenbacteria bacterium]
MRVLVTGGAGFIGSHLVEALLGRGDEVWVIDDLSTGRRENIAHLESNPQFHWCWGTVLDKKLVTETVAKCDLVFHLAAAVGVSYVIKRPLKSLITNIRGAEVVLEAASAEGKKVVLFSSSEVYGKGNCVPFKESDDRVLGPTAVSRWSYATGKAVDEFLALAYWLEKSLPTVVVRCFNSCGPRQTGDYGMVVPRFVTQALLGEPISVYGDGQQSRCFSYVGDVVRGVLLLAEHQGAVGEVFNIGTDEEITIERLAFKIKEITGSSSPVVHVPYEEAYASGFEDMKRRVPDLSKIGALVGYSPSISLDKLLVLTVNDICQRLDIAPPRGLPVVESSSALVGCS